MLVNLRRDQVTLRRKYSEGESSFESATSPILAMFTRAQASAVSAPAKSCPTTTNVSSESVTSAITTVTSGDNNSSDVPVSLTVKATSVVPTLSLNVPEGIPIITTSSVPALDTPTITNLVLNSLEGVHSGVPTRTTPTLTPTTLRNIEQTFLELSTLPPPENHSNQAGFVPPLVQPNGGSTYVSVDSKCWGGGTLTQIPHTSSVTSSSAPTSGALHVRQPPAHTTTTPSSALAMPSQIQQQPQLPHRRMGGRRPVKDEKLSFEEEEKRCLRRERNKLAAARCRKRRLDQTNMLQDETDELEGKKSGLQQEIQLLQQQRDELEFLLATHKAVCRRRFQNSTCAPVTTTSAGALAPMTTAPPTTITSNNSSVHHHVMPTKKVVTLKAEEVIVKEEPIEDDDDDDEDEDDDDEVMAPVTKPEPAPRPRRPTSLAVAPVALRTPSVADLGVPIETPSAGLRGLNFESMMEGGTGLTPVTSGSTGLTPFHTGLTPLTTPVVTAPSSSVSSSSGNCGSQQRSSSSDLSSPDSVPPKLVSL